MYLKGIMLIMINKMHYDMDKIGERVKNTIKEKGLKISGITDNGTTKKETENVLPMTRQTLTKKCKGEVAFTLDDIVDIANYLNVSVSYLLGEDNYTSKEKEVIGKTLKLREETIDRLSQYDDVQISMLNSLICYPHREKSNDNLKPLLNAIYEYKLFTISPKSSITLYAPIYNYKNTYTQKEEKEKLLKSKIESCLDECLKDDYWITDFIKGISTELYLYKNDPDNSSIRKAEKELIKESKRKQKKKR